MRPSIRSSHESEQFLGDASQIVTHLSFCHDLCSSTKSSKHKLLSGVSFTDVQPPKGFPVVEVESIVFVLNYHSSGRRFDKSQRSLFSSFHGGLELLAE